MKKLKERKISNIEKLNNNNGITLIALVITIIVLLILAGVSIATLTGENGVLTQAENAKEETEIATEKEAIALTVTNYNIANEAKYDIGEKLYSRTVANGDRWNIVMFNNIAYGTGWNYVGTGVELESYGKTKEEWLVNYGSGEIIRLEEGNFSKLKYGENLAVTDGIILNADPVNMENGGSWGEGVTLYGVTEGDGYGWNGTELKFDGVDDYIEIYPSNEVNIEDGLTFEFYAYAEGNIDAMLAKSDKDPNNYTTNRFRIQYVEPYFRCCMSGKDSGSNWKVNDTTDTHWIRKEIEGFNSAEGGYITMTVDLETNTIALYWKGEYLDSTVCNHDWLIGGGLTDETIPFTVGMLIGLVNGKTGQAFAKMDLYACRLYNKVLTAEEIQQNCEKTILYHNLLVQENNQ